MKINQADMESALQFLADTDEDFARAQSYYQGLDDQTKTVKAQIAYMCAEKSGTAKILFAERSPEYKKHLDKVQEAHTEYLILKAKRSTSDRVIECWRSLNSARGKGQVV